MTSARESAASDVAAEASCGCEWAAKQVEKAMAASAGFRRRAAAATVGEGVVFDMV